RVAGGQHREQRRLRTLEPEDDGVRIDRLDAVDVGVPLLARIDAQADGRVPRLADDVERELHVLRRERLAVVPADVLAQEENEVAIVVLPGPLLGELTDDRVRPLDRLGLIVDDQVAVARHRGPGDGVGRRLVDQEALREILATSESQYPARLRLHWSLRE